jgi:hypothetical protein
VFLYTDDTGSMLFLLVTRFMIPIAITSYAPLTALKAWLRFSMLYASDDWRGGPREDIIRSIDTSIKTVISLPSECVDGLRGQSSDIKFAFR